MKEKLKNKKLIYIIVGIMGVLLVAVGATYAYWLITRSQTNKNIVSAKCLDISLTDEANAINLVNQLPTSNAKGLELTPLTFTVSNNCDNEVEYQVALELLGSKEESIITEAMRYSIDGKTSYLLSSTGLLNTTIEGAYESRRMEVGILSAKGEDGDSKSHSLRLWLDKDAPESEMQKELRSKITVTVGNIINANVDTLANHIMNDAIENNYLKTETPDFSKPVMAGEYGLYSAPDDYGISYYYRGDIENNYVSLGVYTINGYTPTNFISEEEACRDITDMTPEECSIEYDKLVSIYSNFVIDSQEYCEQVGNEEMGAWTSCEKYESKNKIYSFQDSNLEGVYFKSKDAIYNYLAYEIDGSIDDILEEELAVINTLINDYNVGLNHDLWKIIRINGDGNVRIIYEDGISVLDSSELGEFIYEIFPQWVENRNLNIDILADSTFCYDNSMTDDISNTYIRLVKNNNPKLTCDEQYRASVATTGGNIPYPVGIITADEVMMSGKMYNKNSFSYLGNDEFWTANYADNGTCVEWQPDSCLSCIGGGGSYCTKYAYNTFANSETLIIKSTELYSSANPVINIKGDVHFIGKGTIEEPYEIVNQ